MYLQRNKWTTAKKQTFNGDKYDSGFEASVAQDLEFRRKAGEITRWERQVKIPLVVNGYLIANYYIDFVVYYPNGTVEYVEAKGYATEVWRMKWKIFEALYSEKPDVKLTVIKQRNNFTLRKPKKL